MDFKSIERKWQKKWEDKGVFKTKDNSKKKKMYVLEMFPYPSSSLLHMGHVRNYTIGDAYARFKRMQGFNVLYPMGYDAFGLPAENAAIKDGIPPKEYTEKAIKGIMKNQKELGLSYDWGRLIVTCYPEYYKWNQWFFLKMYEKGLAYRKKAPINWCDDCNTVLANEQVEDGKCWRCHSKVIVKDLEQWFLKITNYADELLKDLINLKGWPDNIKVMQKNWIGKSYGTLVNFKLKDSDETIPVFTTRPDTLFGVTFLVFAPEHPKVMELIKGVKQEGRIKEFINKVVIKDKLARTEEKHTEGMFIERYAINPLTNEEIPIYIANFVLLEYGTGAIMAVPAHDQRDFEFAKKYKVPIKVVINPKEYKLNPDKMSKAYIEEGILVNSGKFDGMTNVHAIEAITKHLEKEKLGKKTIQYKLRDWLISRQRYWGTPIPIIYCNKCGIVPIPERDLPVLLPGKVQFSGKGNPLATSNSFLNVSCPKCKSLAKRETDTMDTFFDSSWYFLRYCDPNNKKFAFDKKRVNHWMPVDQYIGGAEHAVMHLLYARFFCKVLRDMKLVKFDEPFVNLFNQGILYKDGAKMSKSHGNVVNQNEIADKYGIDTARIFLLFVASPDKEMEWNDQGVEGSYRFLVRAYNLLDNLGEGKNEKLKSKLHKTIMDVTNYMESFEFNLAIIELMSFVNYLYKVKGDKKESLKALALLLNPFAPHLSEEMWEKLNGKGFASLIDWPKYDKKKINLELEKEEELVDNTINDVRNVLRLVKIEKPKKVTLFVAEKWKYELFKKLKREVNKTRDIGVIMKKVMIKDHGHEIAKIVPGLVKNVSRIPDVLLTQERETMALEEAKDIFEQEFKLKFEINTTHDKAIPGKPAILIE